MRAIDADALERDGWKLHRTVADGTKLLPELRCGYERGTGMTERDYNYLTELRRLVSELSKIRGALEKIADRTKTNSQLSIELPDLETFFEEMEDDGK